MTDTTQSNDNQTPTRRSDMDIKEDFLKEAMMLSKADLAELGYTLRRRLRLLHERIGKRGLQAYQSVGDYIELNRPDKRNPDLPIAWPQLDEVVVQFRAGDIEAAYMAIEVALSSAEKMVMDGRDDVALAVSRFRPILDFCAKLIGVNEPPMPPGEDPVRIYQVEKIAEQVNRVWTNFLLHGHKFIEAASKDAAKDPHHFAWVRALDEWSQEHVPATIPGDHLENVEECDQFIWAFYSQLEAQLSDLGFGSTGLGASATFFAGCTMGAVKAWAEVVEAARRQQLLGLPVEGESVA